MKAVVLLALLGYALAQSDSMSMNADASAGAGSSSGEIDCASVSKQIVEAIKAASDGLDVSKLDGYADLSDDEKAAITKQWNEFATLLETQKTAIVDAFKQVGCDSSAVETALGEAATSAKEVSTNLEAGKVEEAKSSATESKESTTKATEAASGDSSSSTTSGAAFMAMGAAALAFTTMQ